MREHVAFLTVVARGILDLVKDEPADLGANDIFFARSRLSCGRRFRL
jgi:hypothetical protein